MEKLPSSLGTSESNNTTIKKSLKSFILEEVNKRRQAGVDAKTSTKKYTPFEEKQIELQEAAKKETAKRNKELDTEKSRTLAKEKKEQVTEQNIAESHAKADRVRQDNYMNTIIDLLSNILEGISNENQSLRDLAKNQCCSSSGGGAADGGGGGGGGGGGIDIDLPRRKTGGGSSSRRTPPRGRPRARGKAGLILGGVALLGGAIAGKQALDSLGSEEDAGGGYDPQDKPPTKLDTAMTTASMAAPVVGSAAEKVGEKTGMRLLGAGGRVLGGATAGITSIYDNREEILKTGAIDPVKQLGKTVDGLKDALSLNDDLFSMKRLEGALDAMGGAVGTVSGVGTQIGRFANNAMKDTAIGNAKDSFFDSIFGFIDDVTGGGLSGVDPKIRKAATETTDVIDKQKASEEEQRGKENTGFLGDISKGIESLVKGLIEDPLKQAQLSTGGAIPGGGGEGGFTTGGGMDGATPPGGGFSTGGSIDGGTIAPQGGFNTGGEINSPAPMANVVDTDANRTSTALGISKEKYDIFRKTVAHIESRGKYNISGGSSGRFDGAYQMGRAEQIESAKMLGIAPPSREEFKANPQLQERMFDAYTTSHHNQLMKNPKYAAMTPEQKLQVLGYAHNQGAGGASKYLRTGVAKSDAFKTLATKYSNAIGSNLAALENKSSGTPQENQTQQLKASDINPSNTSISKNAALTGAGTFDKMNTEFAARISLLAQKYQESTGQKLTFKEGYRDLAGQIGAKRRAGANAATPGYSAHGLGLAADMSGGQMNWAARTIDPTTGKSILESLGLARVAPDKKRGGAESWHITPIELGAGLGRNQRLLSIQNQFGGRGNGTLTGDQVLAQAGVQLNDIASSRVGVTNQAAIQGKSPSVGQMAAIGATAMVPGMAPLMTAASMIPGAAASTTGQTPTQPSVGERLGTIASSAVGGEIVSAIEALRKELITGPQIPVAPGVTPLSQAQSTPEYLGRRKSYDAVSYHVKEGEEGSGGHHASTTASSGIDPASYLVAPKSINAGGTIDSVSSIGGTIGQPLQSINGSIQSIAQIPQNVLGAINGGVQGVMGSINGGLQGITGAVQGVAQIPQNIMGSINGGIQGVQGAINGGLGSIQGIAQLPQNVLGAISGGIQGVSGALSGGIQGITGAVQGVSQLPQNIMGSVESGIRGISGSLSGGYQGLSSAMEGLGGSLFGSSSSVGGLLEKKTNDTESFLAEKLRPNITIPAGGGGGGGEVSSPHAGSSAGASGPLITRNNDSSIRRIADSFMSYSWG